MSAKTIDIQAIESILSYIVSKPETVEVIRKVDEMGVLLILRVDRSDMGIVIGRNGEMANAIKKYIKKVGQVNNMNIRLRIDEPVEGEPSESDNDTPLATTTPNPSDTNLNVTPSYQSSKDVSSSTQSDLEEFSLN
jgi:uncharacterized protein